MNNSEQPVKLHRGTILGQLSCVSVEESAVYPDSNAKAKKCGLVNLDLTQSCQRAEEKERVEKLVDDYGIFLLMRPKSG